MLLCMKLFLKWQGSLLCLYLGFALFSLRYTNVWKILIPSAWMISMKWQNTITACVMTPGFCILRSSAYCLRTIFYLGAKLWKGLPLHMKNVQYMGPFIIILYYMAPFGLYWGQPGAQHSLDVWLGCAQFRGIPLFLVCIYCTLYYIVPAICRTLYLGLSSLLCHAT